MKKLTESVPGKATEHWLSDRYPKDLQQIEAPTITCCSVFRVTKDPTAESEADLREIDKTKSAVKSASIYQKTKTKEDDDLQRDKTKHKTHQSSGHCGWSTFQSTGERVVHFPVDHSNREIF